MPLQVWEYRVLKAIYDKRKSEYVVVFDEPWGHVVGVEAVCNLMGANCWELVQLHQDQPVDGYSRLNLYFKRPKQ